jgi:CheY-like chemotaxis protein
MPNMDGIDFARVLKAKLPHAGIIISSGAIVEQTREELEHMGVLAMLEKPFTADQLIETLRNFFKG